MKPVYLRFYHEEFDLLSDRSIRQFMKKVGTAVKEAQLSEIDDFIFSLDLDYARQRSMQDRLKNDSQSVPAYYVETIKKGSLTALFLVGVGLIGVLVRNTIVNVIDDEDVRTEVLKGLRKFLKNEWGRSLAETIGDKLAGRELGSHVVVDVVDIEEKKSKTVVNIKLKTVVDEEDTPRRPEDTPGTIDREIDRQLKRSSGSRTEDGK
jgi:hypothetical protein